MNAESGKGKRLRAAADRIRRWTEKQANRYTPPGYDGKGELRRMRLLLLAAFAAALVFAGIRYAECYRGLFTDGMPADWISLGTGESRPVFFARGLREGAVMDPFSAFVPYILPGFFAAGILMLAQALFHSRYLRQESKSIYLMRRLPDGKELYRRCLVLPAAEALLCLACGYAVMFLCFGLYLLLTPGACLIPGQWREAGGWLIRIWP